MEGRRSGISNTEELKYNSGEHRLSGEQKVVLRSWKTRSVRSRLSQTFKLSLKEILVVVDLISCIVKGNGSGKTVMSDSSNITE